MVDAKGIWCGLSLSLVLYSFDVYGFMFGDGIWAAIQVGNDVIQRAIAVRRKELSN